MYKNIKKSMIILGATTLALSNFQHLSFAENANQNEVKYADGTYIGEGYGYYEKGSTFDEKDYGGKYKGQVKPPLKIDVTFKDNIISSIKLHEGEGYIFPDDSSYSHKGKKSLKFLEKKILKSNNYEEDLKTIFQKLSDIYDKTNDDGDLISGTIQDYDIITSATATTKGYTSAVIDALNQAKNKANDVKQIERIDIIEKMNEDKYFAGDKYDLSKLKVKLTFEGGSTKEVSYSELERNNLKISIIQGNKSVLIDGDLRLSNPKNYFDIIISSKYNEQRNIKYTVIPKLKIFNIKNLYYRVGGEGEFKPVTISDKGSFKNYDIILNASDLGEMIEFKTTEFFDNSTKESLKEDYYFKPVLLEDNINRRYVSIDNRANISPEDSEYIYPIDFQGGGITIYYNKSFKDDIGVKIKELEGLVEKNRGNNDEKIKALISKYDKLYEKVNQLKIKKEDLENEKEKLNKEYEELGRKKNEAMKAFIDANRDYKVAEEAYNKNKTDENKQKLDKAKGEKEEKKKAFDESKKKWENKYDEINEISKKIVDLDNEKVSNHDWILILKNLKQTLNPEQPGDSTPKVHNTTGLKEDIKKKIEELSKVKDMQKDKEKKLVEAKIKKAQNFLEQVNKEGDNTNYLVYEWYIKELDYAKSKLNNESKPNDKKDDKKDVKEKIKVERLSGKDRFDTSVELSKKYFKTADTVVIASGENYPDALSASALAGVEKAPILLVSKDSIKKSVIDEIKRLGAKKVIIVGGTSSIDSNIAKSINGIAKIELVAGKDRYETSKLIAKRVMKNGYKDSILIVDGKNYPDSLAASSLVEKYKAPILLVNNSGNGMLNVDFARDSSVKSNVILGGTKSVSLAIENKLNNSKRIAGKNRYETSRMIAKEVLTSNKDMFIANGKTYPDSLSAGSSVIKEKGALVLIDDSNVNINGLKDYNPSKIVAVGGSSSINSKILDLLNK